tara:strand:+ start:48 stop:329 length:282 start_codon:yes stop_codon:yes gene_type:complete
MLYFITIVAIIILFFRVFYWLTRYKQEFNELIKKNNTLEQEVMNLKFSLQKIDPKAIEEWTQSDVNEEKYKVSWAAKLYLLRKNPSFIFFGSE